MEAKEVAAATQAVTGGRQGLLPGNLWDDTTIQVHGTPTASEVDQLRACISRLERNQAEMQSLQSMQQMWLQTARSNFF